LKHDEVLIRKRYQDFILYKTCIPDNISCRERNKHIFKP